MRVFFTTISITEKFATFFLNNECFAKILIVCFHQALPLVSTFWGVLLFGEYRMSSRRTYILLGLMLFMFVAAVAVLMASSGRRSSK